MCPARYSPALRPSSSRAAPAKKRIWSIAGGSSSVRVSSIGLPVFWHSAAMMSSARSSIASANLSSARWRSDGVLSRHDSNALAAAEYAASTSCSPDRGDVPNTSPVVGSTRSSCRPSLASTLAPLMKFWTVRLAEDVVTAPTLPTPSAAHNNEFRCFRSHLQLFPSYAMAGTGRTGPCCRSGRRPLRYAWVHHDARAASSPPRRGPVTRTGRPLVAGRSTPTAPPISMEHPS